MAVAFDYKSQNRYIIYDDGEWTGDFSSRSVTCSIRSVHDLSDATLCLRDLWADAQFIKKGIHIGIVGVQMDEDRCFVIDRENGYLVIEPDSLLSITSVVSAFFCERKTVFNERMRLPINNRAMLEGVISHEMLGRAMLLPPEMRNRSQLQTIAFNILRNSGIMLNSYAVGLSSQELTTITNSLISYVLTFMHERYGGNRKAGQNIVIDEVVDIEDTIWSPTFGLKGKFDATVNATISSPTGENKTVTIPLEFKTGNMDPTNRTGKPDHVGQVQLYSLLMNERYNEVTTGLLYYLKPNTLIENKMDRRILQPLIIARNRITLIKKFSNGSLVNLPKPSVTPKLCMSCEHRVTCALLTRTTPLESLADFRNPTEEALIQSLRHLRNDEIEFYKSWFTLITLETEAVEGRSTVKSLWTVPARQRERAGSCISQLHYISAMDCRSYGYEGVYAQFSRAGDDSFDFQALQLAVQDMVVLSSETDIGFAYGVIESIDPPKIIVKLERVYKRFTTSRDGLKASTFMIDKTQSFSPMMVQYGFLQALMADNPRASKLRKYIIDKEEPLFPSINPRDILAHGSLRLYNRMQREVIVNAIRTDSFLFIKGMPGTGKTVTIVALLKFLTRMGKTVLVTAYTGSAVDNILIKCHNQKLDNFMRVGEPKIRHFALLQRTDKAIIQNSKTYEEMQNRFNIVPIVGTTLLNVKHEIFQVRKFDYVIVDEASQALPSAVFGALLLGDKYIIVGDPDQLPTVTLTTATRELELKDNFFSMMATDGNTKLMNEQYRMNETIMALSNQLVYGGKMIANDMAALATIRISSSRSKPYIEKLQQENPSKASMMKYVLSRDLDLAVLFLNTVAVGSTEMKSDSSLMNVKEAEIVSEIANAFVTLGIKPECIGIIAPYRGQVNLIRSLIASTSAVEIEVNTVDQYQGRDKDIIICSFTKTKVSGLNRNNVEDSTDRKGAILEDVRRLNVALTRAKLKLVMVGHGKALSVYDPLKQLFSILRPTQMFEIDEHI